MLARGRARCWRGSGSTRGTGCGRSRVEELPLGVSALESTADAVLVIGDRAMRVPHEPFVDVVDLAEAWNALTALPFVFAFWVARAGVELDELPAALLQSRAHGAGRRQASLARIHGQRLGLDVERVLRLLDASSVLRSRGARAGRAEAICRDGRPAGAGAGRSEPCLPLRPRSCTAPLTAIA